jgi:hypothetical protein
MLRPRFRSISRTRLGIYPVKFVSPPPPHFRPGLDLPGEQARAIASSATALERETGEVLQLDRGRRSQG